MPLSHILTATDAGTPVAAIATACNVTPGRVYAVLRRHRPNRTRSPRTRTSTVPLQVLALVRDGVSPTRTAKLLGIKRQYVHRIVKEAARERR